MIIRGLTLWQPWAEAILRHGKRVENRPWEPPSWMIGQLIAIHASVRMPMLEEVRFVERTSGIPMAKPLARGAIVGLARLESVVHESAGDPWFFGPFGWVLSKVVAFEEPVTCRGYQRLWSLPPDVLDRVEEMWITGSR